MDDWHRAAGTRVTATDWTGAVWFLSYSMTLSAQFGLLMGLNSVVLLKVLV